MRSRDESGEGTPERMAAVPVAGWLRLGPAAVIWLALEVTGVRHVSLRAASGQPVADRPHGAMSDFSGSGDLPRREPKTDRAGDGLMVLMGGARVDLTLAARGGAQTRSDQA